ncbi:hypothetical protein [Infirmifilum sp. SLHALR2]|nr:MAG: hypothetical protein B7L53_01645 [Thermofilum sp. NZ13]
MNIDFIISLIFELLMNLSRPIQSIPSIQLLILLTAANILLFAVAISVSSRCGGGISMNQTSHHGNLFVFITLAVLIAFEWWLLLGIPGAVIGEETPDAFLIFKSGHWARSLKNPYYDLIDVHAFYMALFALLGELPVESIFSDLPLSMAIGLFLAVALRALIKKHTNIGCTSFFILFLALVAVPVVNLFSWYLAAPMALALLAMNFAIPRSDKTKWIIFALLYSGALLFHGSAMLATLLPLSYVFVRIFLGNADKSSDVKTLAFATSLSLIMNVLRFLYTTAYLGAETYWHELLRFLNLGLQATTREPHWFVPQIPRITLYSFTVLPAMASTPLLLYILSKISKRLRCHSIDSHYLAHLLTGGTMLLMGLLASTFSNSLSRELGYPGFIFVAISAAYTLKHVEERGVLQVAFALIVAIAYALSLFTPTVNIWLYLPSNPIPSYTPTTYESYLIAEAIASRYTSGLLSVKSVYSIPIWYSAFTRVITVLEGSSQAGSLILSSDIAEAWWS